MADGTAPLNPEQRARVFAAEEAARILEHVSSTADDVLELARFIVGEGVEFGA